MLFSFEGTPQREINPVVIALRFHLFPYRTQKLSSIASMVLGGRPPGRVERCRIYFNIPRELSWQSMRLLTAGSSVRAGLEEPKQKSMSLRHTFLLCLVWLERTTLHSKQPPRLLTEPKATAAGGGRRELEDAQKPGDAGTRKGVPRRPWFQAGVSFVRVIIYSRGHANSS